MYNTISIACVRPVERFYISGLSNSQWMVYPHVCGEHSPFKSLNENPSGTSPRLWGDYSGTPPHVRVLRYIPTPVGRLNKGVCVNSTSTVHPHACGEIMPWRCRYAYRAVHPHACGEIFLTKLLVLMGIGTSPRLWGDCLLGVCNHWEIRYIPTPVGRLDSKTPVKRARDGTSPRLWGDWIQRRGKTCAGRYIPTPVGRFLLGSVQVVKIVKVHPHACGEIFMPSLAQTRSAGTSPRLWGDCDYRRRHIRSLRYIPTPVGRFDSARQATKQQPVHPHACGEIV